MSFEKKSSLSFGRRAFLGGTAMSALGALLARYMPVAEAAGAQKSAVANARACIVLWMNGGMSHVDTFDPKPKSKGGGPFKAIGTKLPGLSFSQHLPGLASVADELCVVRGMVSKEGNHDRARYLMHTGYVPNPTVSHPSLSAWVSKQKGDPNSELPTGVAVNGYAVGGGFLGPQHAPFVVQNPSKMPRDIAPPKGIDDARQRARLDALDSLETSFAASTNDSKIGAHRAVYARASRMMAAPTLSAFDVTQEPAASRNAYGDTDFGRGVLLARRLVEVGVGLVEVTLDGWDTHQDNFSRTEKLMGTLDPAFSSLIRDLKQRNLLDSTLVVCLGDFGRTPVINANDGRDHHPNAWSLLMAGGGLRRGVVYGETDADGETVVKSPVRVPDLFATIVSRLGISPDDTFQTPLGRPLAITDGGVPIAALLG